MKDAHGNKLPPGYSLGQRIANLEWSQVDVGLRVLWRRYITRFGWIDEPATIVGFTKKMVKIRPDGSCARYVPIHVIAKDERNCLGI